MKKIVLFLVLFTAVFFSLFAQDTFKQEGIASWYGTEYDGRPTASGEIFDSSQLTAAHPSLPFGTRLVVTNQHNNKSVTVRVNDRGPFVPARIIDVSKAAAEQIDMIITGTAPVKVESIDKITISTPAQEILPAQQPQTVLVPAIQTQEIAPVVQPVIIQPVAAPAPQIPQQVFSCTITPTITIVPEKSYRLQVGSYKNARNAVTAFDKLKSAGLNPAYERFIPDGNNEYFRVVLAGVRGSDIQLTTEKLGEAGFREALIKEEN